MKTKFYHFSSLGGVLVGLSTIAIYNYSTTKFEAINSYFGELLHRTEIKGVSGPHYWKNGKVFGIRDGYLRSSSDLGVTWVAEISLPEYFREPAQSISEFILADQSNVYLRQGDQFHRVLDGFRCWYVCGSQLKSKDFVVGEYGDRIYYLEAVTGKTRLLFTKPPDTRHFHLTSVDPFTNDIYTSLGDAHKARVTGIMRSRDNGQTWEWLHKTRDGAREQHRQPTAIYFEQDVVYFGSDNSPHGIFIMDRRSGAFQFVFVMNKIFQSWFPAMTKKRGSFWAISRSQKRPSFGLLWWSSDGKKWVPIQVFRDAPVWLQTDDKRNLISIGFLKQEYVFAYDLPDAAQMVKWINAGPRVNLLDRLLADFQDRLLPER